MDTHMLSATLRQTTDDVFLQMISGGDFRITVFLTCVFYGFEFFVRD